MITINNKIAKITGSVLLSLLGVAGVKGQPLMNGQVTVRNLFVSHSDDKLFISMDIDVSGLEVKSNREVIFTPALASDDNTLSLPAVLIAGRNRYYHHLRNDNLRPATTQIYRRSDVSVVEYRTVVPYEKWMNTSKLVTLNEVCGCCDETLAGENEPLLALRLEPKAFVPSYIYIRPKAEPKINVLEGSAYIDFPVNRTEIHENYRRNPVELQKILSTIDAVRNDADTRIISVSIKGYASPESPYSNNERLAMGRTKTLKEYVRKQYNFADSQFITDYEPEDWAGLERYVESSSLDNKAGILALIRSNMDPDAKERSIKTAFPKEHAFLLKEVYPGLRHSDYAVKYEVRAYTDVEEIKRLIKTQPQKLSLNEMYLAAQEMEIGSEEYNETFDIAVRMFPDDEVANLNAANIAMSRGSLKSAERYLQKAGDSPQAIYARATLAALNKDFDTAEKMFEEAVRKGIPDAEKMLRQIEEIK